MKKLCPDTLAKKTFFITIISCAAYCAAVYVFIVL
jgi:hypothetical protein